MLVYFQFLVAVILIGSMAYFRMPRIVCLVVTTIVLFYCSIFTRISWWLLTPAWLIFLILAPLFSVTSFRQRWITTPLLAYLKRSLPPLSATEKEAIEAGEVWWEAELFSGRPNWKKLYDLPKSELSAEEQHFIEHQTTALCSILDDWDIVHDRWDLPDAVWKTIKDQGFWGMMIPKQYGGLGFTALLHSTVITKVASRSISAAVSIMVPNSLGPAELLLHYGTEEQKNYYLPRLAKGIEVPCFALTAPDAGSDAGSMLDSGIVCKGEYEGKTVTGIRLSWDKRYITLAPIATLIGLAFKLYDPDKLLGDKKEIGITLALIPASHPGVTVGARHNPLGLAFMNGPVKGHDVFIPLDWIIGGVESAGKGWHMLMECLSIGRSISLPALSTALAQLAYRTTGAYSVIRRQFKVPIGQFEGIEEALSRVGGFTYLLEASRLMTAGAVSRGIKPAIVSAITKYHMTELSRKCVNDAMDIHAGRGIQLGPRNYLGLGYQALPISITVEGANILTRNLIIFGQGAIRCHPYLLKEIAAANDVERERGFHLFDQLLQEHMGYFISNFTRSLVFSFSGSRLAFSWRTPYRVSKYHRQLNRMSSALAVLSDIALLRLGGSLKRRERLSARLGDVLSHLYLASTVLKYFHDQKNPKSDQPFVAWTINYCLFHIQEAMEGFLNNFPYRVTAVLLRFLVFPWGRPYKMPSDASSRELASLMQIPSELRDRLTQYCFMGDKNDDPVRIVEEAFIRSIEVKPLEAKIKQAIQKGQLMQEMHFENQINRALFANIITQQEADKLLAFEEARKKAIAVDEFDADHQQNKFYNRTQASIKNGYPHSSDKVIISMNKNSNDLSAL